jgi:hypothetical protein
VSLRPDLPAGLEGVDVGNGLTANAIVPARHGDD